MNYQIGFDPDHNLVNFGQFAMKRGTKPRSNLHGRLAFFILERIMIEGIRVGVKNSTSDPAPTSFGVVIGIGRDGDGDATFIVKYDDGSFSEAWIACCVAIEATK